MHDNELYELCKSVYEATGWDNTRDAHVLSAKGSPVIARDDRVERTYPMTVFINEYDSYDLICPYYTSDYLLEKLPPALWINVADEHKQVALLSVNMRGNGEADAVYEIPYDKEFRGEYNCFAETPLKALLKMTLRLHREGLLDAKDN